MSDLATNACGCCTSLDVETPSRIDNRPGQSAIAYRVGVHASFRESLLARLSSTDLPALAGLGSRDDADFTIALCDALATSLDVLSFYQERIANEHYLRTATERRSIRELARLIGYRLAPGVAASTHLAFTLQETPGNAALAAKPVTIPVGTRVQSVPAPGQQPQTFETMGAVEARTEWNAIPVQRSLPWQPLTGDRALWLAGVGSGLQTGDIILILDWDRFGNVLSSRWDIRVLTGIEEDRIRQRTRLSWRNPLGNVVTPPGQDSADVSVWVFRQRAALFGHNAPDPRLMFSDNNPPPRTLVDGSVSTGDLRWANFSMGDAVVDLDNAYPKIVPGGWFALVSNTLSQHPSGLSGEGVDSANWAGDDELPQHPSGLSGEVRLYRAQAVSFPSRNDYALSGKITRLTPDTTHQLSLFKHTIRDSMVLAQSEPLPVAARPLAYPLYGHEIRLARLEPDIAPGRVLAISGQRARIRLRQGMMAMLQLQNGDQMTLRDDQTLRIASAPERQTGGQWLDLPAETFGSLLANNDSGQLRLALLDRDGRLGVLIASAAALALAPAEPADERVQEIVVIDKLPTAVGVVDGLSRFTLRTALKHCYDRDTATINANVAKATHGETVTEIVGNGDARVANPTFALRHSPLTFISANSPSGRQSTLEFRANDLLWAEVDSLYRRDAKEKVYEWSIDDEARTSLRFGDGVEGARLPSGDHNLRVTYRKGLGLAGNVAADQLSNLLSRPLGVTGAFNPEAASGGEDPESQRKARANAPLTVLTLERAVSIRDYQDFARAFAGIAKAHALWMQSGPARGVFLTVAGENGAEVPTTSDTYAYLLAALRRFGDPLQPLRIVSYRDVRFGLKLQVKVAAAADPTLVLPAVGRRLAEAYGFEARNFGQGVAVDEIAEIAQAIGGVEAVQVTELFRQSSPLPRFSFRLFAETPIASLSHPPLAAELLTLDATLLTVEPLQ